MASGLADQDTGLELEVFAGLGLYPTYVVMQGFSTSTSVVLLSILNVYDSSGQCGYH